MYIALAQINPLVGDIVGNTEKVINAIQQAVTDTPKLDAIVFPELCLTGYPPEDLLLRDSLNLRIDKAIGALTEYSKKINAHIIVGYPLRKKSSSSDLFNSLFNCAGVFYQGQKKAEYQKQCLPNYRVFDEKRYFSAGDSVCIFDLNGTPTALTICEDIWQAEPMQQAKSARAKLMLNINASPFHLGKQREREALLGERAIQGDMPIVYVNQVGGQDELVFDGGSCVVQNNGDIVYRSETFQEDISTFCLPADLSTNPSVSSKLGAKVESDALGSLYQALVLGVKDYVNKNGFKGVVLGLSGGIDSALTLAIAADALGAERVEAVMMPFRYTADMSVEDAKQQADTLGVAFSSIPIESIYSAFINSLENEFAGEKKDTTEENLQARSRGVLLMAISNKKGYLVLTTGNKSEMAVGYCTLYGDMAGGFAAIKDVSKTQVYALARYRNQLAEVIPQRVIDRPPSAELAPDQKDEDSLPPYDELDRILELYVEEDASADDIIREGFSQATVQRVLRLVDINEYKRRQAPIGVRVTQRGFGRDRRYPITNGWHIGE